MTEGWVGAEVLPRKGSRGQRKPGVVVGERRCQAAWCRGTAVIVRWPDGSRTCPCVRGLTYDQTTKAWRLA